VALASRLAAKALRFLILTQILNTTTIDLFAFRIEPILRELSKSRKAIRIEPA